MGNHDDDGGEVTFGRYHKHLDNIAQIIFIRHGEKISDAFPDLNDQGYFRAANLDRVFGRGNPPPGTYNTPDVIYAMQQGKRTSNSNRPFETVAPLARSLGMEPQMDERTGTAAGIFDNTFSQKDKQELVDDIVKNARGPYIGKTVMICWEHKNIPLIIADMGLASKELFWGLDPESGENTNNFNAIWVFTPSKKKFQVFQEFNVDPPEGTVNDPNSIRLVDPNGGYEQAVYSVTVTPNRDED